jgi:hypothetical protein
MSKNGCGYSDGGKGCLFFAGFRVHQRGETGFFADLMFKARDEVRIEVSGDVGNMLYRSCSFAYLTVNHIGGIAPHLHLSTTRR